MRAIRKMEPAWEKVNGCKFALVEYQDKKGELRPCYQLTKTECLYIATKFIGEGPESPRQRYSIVFPNCTPINVNKKKRNYEDSIP